MRPNIVLGLIATALAGCSGGGSPPTAGDPPSSASGAGVPSPGTPPIGIPGGGNPGAGAGAGALGGGSGTGADTGTGTAWETIPCPITAQSSDESSGSAPPTLEITFPFEHAPYDRDSIGISGRIDAGGSLAVVTACIGEIGVIGRVAADGRFVIADLPVTSTGPSFTIEIEAVNPNGSVVRRSMTLSREPTLSHVPSLILDAARNRLVGVDTYSSAVYAISLADYRRESIAAWPRHEAAAPMLVKPVAIAHDSAADVFYVVDDELDALVAVHPDGTAAVVSDRSTGSGPTILTPVDVVYDAARGRVLVADDGRKAVMAVDPRNGDRAIVSSRDVGSGPVIPFFTGMDLDENRDRLIVVAGNSNEIYTVDLQSGGRTLLSDASLDPPQTSRFFEGISVASGLGVAYLADEFSNAVVRVDLFTGLRQSISSSGLVTPSLLIRHPVIGQGPLLEWPSDVVFDAAANRLFVTDHDFAQPLIEIDESTGDRILRSDSSIGTGVNFRDLVGIDLDAANDRAYVADFTADVVAAVDLRSGNRTLIEGPANGRGTIDTGPEAVAVDATAGQAYVVDLTTSTLYALDLADGARRIVADAAHGSGPALSRPFDIELDPASGRAYVLDRGLGALLAVDLATGDRSLVSEGASGFALDLEHGRIFAAVDGEIDVIDVEAGTRSVLSANKVGFGQGFRHAVDLALDSAHGRLVVLDDLRNAVFTVDIATGDREIISGDSSLVLLVGSSYETVWRMAGGGPPLARPSRIVVDSERQIAYVADSIYDAIFAVDLGSGYRQIVAK